MDFYPRNYGNIDLWNKIMKKVCDTEFVLFFDSETGKKQERMIEHSKTNGRSLENPENIKKQLETLPNANNNVMIKYYNKQGKVARINADGDIDSIFS